MEAKMPHGHNGAQYYCSGEQFARMEQSGMPEKLDDDTYSFRMSGTKVRIVECDHSGLRLVVTHISSHYLAT